MDADGTIELKRHLTIWSVGAVASSPDTNERQGASGFPDSGTRSRGKLVLARLFIGLVVLVCTEVFSGASVQVGLWHPWTWVVTCWLYFAHFFLFTTLAVRTGRTSFWSLYLWGVLFGLYETWITKVVWHGYSGDGEFVMGTLGPYGYSELSMVFLFHPVAAFILPLAVSCLLCPSLRRHFPNLAWLTSGRRGARAVRVYMVASFAVVLAMNSGGPAHLALNLAIGLGLLALRARLARAGLAVSDGTDIVVFGRLGFRVLCAYLAVLYGVTYAFLRPDGLPSVVVQLATFVAYAVVIVGLRLHPRRDPSADTQDQRRPEELGRVLAAFGAIFALSLALSPLAGRPAIYLPVTLNFVLWTPLGFLLTLGALVLGARRTGTSPAKA